MKIVNETHWRTDQLKKIISRVAKDELSPAKRKVLVVTIKYRRTDRGDGLVSGHASLGGTRMQLNVNKAKIHHADFACTTAHEMAHIRGLHHPAMRGRRSYYREVSGCYEMYAWATDCPIEPQEKKVKVVDVVAERHARIAKRVAGWEAKLKRASNALKKLRPQLRYYERQAANRPKPEGK